MASVTACESNPTLVVDVVTELCPDITGGPRCIEERFDTVVVSLGRDSRVARPVEDTDRYLDGQRVAEITDIVPGEHMVSVELLRAGVVIARARRSVAVFDAVQTIRVAIQSDCAGVLCPAEGGDPTATECLSGGCIDPACFDPEGAPDSCGAICESDADCTPSVACGETRCVEHVCIELLRDTACAAGERCLRDLGCFGGVLEGDPCETADDCGATMFICCGNACRQPDCNDGNECTNDSCTRDGCMNLPSDAACDDRVFCNGADTCQAGACGLHAGSPCSGGAALCDEPTTSCLGCAGDADCPAMQEQPISGCGGATGECGGPGTQTFRITTYSCTAGSCVPAMRDEPRGCSVLATPGTPCGTGGSTCNATGMCTCGGAVCAAGRYCNGGSCWDYPRIEMVGAPSPECVDGALGPQPGDFAGYRLYGRPGARIHKYNQRTSCGEGWVEAVETSGAAVYIPPSGVYVVSLDSPTALPCDFGEYGHYEQYAEVDGLRVPPTGTVGQSWYNSGCANVPTCLAGNTYCP